MSHDEIILASLLGLGEHLGGTYLPSWEERDSRLQVGPYAPGEDVCPWCGLETGACDTETLRRAA